MGKDFVLQQTNAAAADDDDMCECECLAHLTAIIWRGEPGGSSIMRSATVCSS